jgi:uncharacterized membrane protein
MTPTTFSHRAITSRACILALVLSLAFAGAALAKDKDTETDTRPERALTMNFEYPEVAINAGDDVTVDLIVKNKGRSDENVYFTISDTPTGWKSKLKTYSFTISSVHVPDGEDKSVQFTAESEKTTKPGTYTFTVTGSTEDKAIVLSHSLTITLQEKKEEAGGIELTTSYPVMQGSSDKKFEFSIEVKNKTGKEKTFNLSATANQYWQVNFKPSYEDKYISSLRLKDDESKSLDVEVTPDRLATAGSYPIPLVVSAGEAKETAELTVIITGTHKLEAGTATGLLSLETQKGKTGNISIYVKNTGSAPLTNLEFLSVKPENWKVAFDPETIDALEPGNLKQIELTVTPATEALVGDYAVGVNIKSEKATDDLELRVTVKASAAWGWIGIGIIILVIIGLFTLFVTLGRR